MEGTPADDKDCHLTWSSYSFLTANSDILGTYAARKA